MKEKFISINTNSQVNIEENKIISFDKSNLSTYSFRVGEDGLLGVHYQEGDMREPGKIWNLKDHIRLS